MKILKVLIACEESQRVCTEFRKLEHEAYSADIQEPSGGHPEWHIKGDVLEVLNPKDHLGDFEAPMQYISFKTMDGSYHEVEKWDLIVAHPPCTYLTCTGNRWFNVKRYGDKAVQRIKDREEAAKFFMQFANADCDHIAIENPIGYMSTFYRKADQIIQPYQFGDPVRKATCLWLKGLHSLQPTNIVKPEIIIYKNGKTDDPWHYNTLSFPLEERARERSKTFEGIAQAMAQQWSDYLTGKSERQLSLFEEAEYEEP